VPDYSNRWQALAVSGGYNLRQSFPARPVVHRTTICFFLLFFLVTFPSYSSPQDVGSQLPGAAPADEGEMASRAQKEMGKKANAQRQADLKRDAEKLLKLSTELKEYVDKSNENVLSLAVINKAEEIEKLAHSVKVKMRGD
jgi:hypothetical protein